MKCEQGVLCLSPDIVSCHWFGFSEFYNSSCPVVHSAVSFLDTTTPAPLMDSVVAPVRCLAERTGAWEQKLAWKNAELIGGEHHEGFVVGVAVADLPIICI